MSGYSDDTLLAVRMAEATRATEVPPEQRADPVLGLALGSALPGY